MSIWAVDTETTGLYWHQGHRPFIWGAYNGVDYVVSRDFEYLKEWIKGKTCVFHNAKFDIAMLGKMGVEVENYHDTMLMMSLLDENRKSIALKVLAKDLLGEETNEKAEVDKALKLCETFDKLPDEILEKYLKKDVFYTFKLYELLWPRIVEEKLEGIYEIERVLVKTLIYVEENGVFINNNKLQRLKKQLKPQIEEVENQLKKFGVEYTSGQQLGNYLEEQGFTLKVTKKGKKRVDADMLAEIDHPICPLVLKYRKLEHPYTTYCVGIENNLSAESTLHPNIISYKAVTGRFSCSEPNLQNLPKPIEGDEESRWIRGLVEPREDFFLVAIDYGQIEYRIAADYIEDEELIEAIDQGMDVHTFQARRIFKTEDVTKEQRSKAKTLNFAILYGAGKQRIADMMGVSLSEALSILNIFWQENPKINELKNLIARTFNRRGYIINKFGRRYRIPRDTQYKALNYLCQGVGTGDMMKVVMNRVFPYLKYKKSKLLLNIHDELLFEIHKDEKHIIPELVRIMTDLDEFFKVKITVDVKYSNESWSEMHDYE